MGEIFNIAAGNDFLAALVDGIAARYAKLPPEEIAAIRIFLPTARSCLRLRDIFPQRWPGNALLLPRITPLGETGSIEQDMLEAGQTIDMPPVMPGFSRQMKLATLIMKKAPTSANINQASAMNMAASLIRLLDEAAREELSWTWLDNMSGDDYAKHWQVTLDFLREIIADWNSIVKNSGMQEPVTARNRWLRMLAESWQAKPDLKVIIAGSTGSQKATRRLMRAALTLKDGHVILPAFDAAETELPPTHPQYAISSLLQEFDISDVADWHESAPSPRIDWMRQIMLPAEATPSWHDKKWQQPQSINLISAESAEEEAKIIALLLKETLHQPDKKAALITTNRQLARMVAAELKKMGINCDDSAGRPLSTTPPAVLLRLLAELPFATDQISSLLAILKHPLTDFGTSAAACRLYARKLEKNYLRKRRVMELHQALNPPEHDEMATTIRTVLTPWLEAARQKRGFRVMNQAYLEAAQKISSSVFARPYTSAMQSWLEIWRQQDIEFDDFAAALDCSLELVTYRPSYGQHPRIAILSPMEARLLHVEHFILGSMNEGSWPLKPASDGWMNLPMRRRFGLPDYAENIGQSAHDLWCLLAAPKVTLTRAAKEDGADTMASRWWQRIEALNKLAPEKAAADVSRIWQNWAEDATPAPVEISAPRPAPLTESRPRRLSVTEIEKLLKDPYSIYARHVLGLRQLDELEKEPDASDFGSLVHQSLEETATSGTELTAIMERKLAAFDRGVTLEYWQPRLTLIAEKFNLWHATRKEECRDITYEHSMEATLKLPGGDFIIHGRADRIELLPDGSARVIDYKTKYALPEGGKLKAFQEPQLPLEAWLLLQSPPPGWRITGDIEMEYWHLRGKPTDCISKVPMSGREAAEKVATLLTDLLTRYDDRATPYLASPASKKADEAYTNAHLERLKEWRFG